MADLPTVPVFEYRHPCGCRDLIEGPDAWGAYFSRDACETHEDVDVDEDPPMPALMLVYGRKQRRPRR